VLEKVERTAKEKEMEKERVRTLFPVVRDLLLVEGATQQAAVRVRLPEVQLPLEKDQLRVAALHNMDLVSSATGFLQMA